eukprot:UN11645
MDYTSQQTISLLYFAEKKLTLQKSHRIIFTVLYETDLIFLWDLNLL